MRGKFLMMEICSKESNLFYVFQLRKSWLCHKNCYVLCKTNNFGRNFRNILLFNFENISKPKKTFCEIKFFLGTRFPSSTTISSSGKDKGLAVVIVIFYKYLIVISINIYSRIISIPCSVQNLRKICFYLNR